MQSSIHSLTETSPPYGPLSKPLYWHNKEKNEKKHNKENITLIGDKPTHKFIKLTTAYIPARREPARKCKFRSWSTPLIHDHHTHWWTHWLSNWSYDSSIENFKSSHHLTRRRSAWFCCTRRSPLQHWHPMLHTQRHFWLDPSDSSRERPHESPLLYST